jgi:glycosyltransferase involved in cell wall biosynthesis
MDVSSARDRTVVTPLDRWAPPPSIIYNFSFAHHGVYSGLPRLTHYLSDQCVIDVTWRSVNRLPARISTVLMRRWLRYSEHRLRRHLRSATPRCVHYIHPENTLHQSWRWKGHHKFVLTVHQPPAYLERMRHEPTAENFFRALELADAVIAPDPESLNAYRMHAPKARLDLIPHGVDVEFFRPDANACHQPIILTVGNWFRDYECWAQVVRALSVQLPGVQFEVIANPSTVREVHAVLGAHSLPVRFFTGLSDLELRAAYARAQLMFLPLTNSAANTAVLESLAMGLPLVITDLPATRFYIGTEAGRYVYNTDIAGCVATLAKLAGDAQQRECMAAAARARAVAEFDWQRIADRHRALYRALLDPHA